VSDRADALRALLALRDDVERRHAAAVALLEEQGPDFAFANRPKCAALYDELAAVQTRIDEWLDEERER
jgi:hypothetical protein